MANENTHDNMSELLRLYGLKNRYEHETVEEEYDRLLKEEEEEERKLKGGNGVAKK